MKVDIMNSFAPAVNEVYLEYASRLLQHHRLLAEGRESSDEAILVEDEMTELWEQLDPVQRKSLSGLGSDLNWVRRGGQPAPYAPKPDDVSPEDRKALEEAGRVGDWHRLLHQLRACATSIPWSESARLRAEAWSKLGQAHIAGVFQEFLSRAPDLSSSSGPKPQG